MSIDRLLKGHDLFFRERRDKLPAQVHDLSDPFTAYFVIPLVSWFCVMNTEDKIAVGRRCDILAMTLGKSPDDHVTNQLGNGLIEDGHGSFSKG